mmetsp:Transcript_15201/g.25379  ORF Transcript_15201/g.25379 Transcript_15201/m.25379 type:complete len:200 (-) Transcript_15201:549-1148(-)
MAEDEDCMLEANEEETTLATSTGTTMATAGASVPPGIKVSWSERQERLNVMIELSEPEDPHVSLGDDGQLTVQVCGGNDRDNFAIQLQLFGKIDSAKTRWSLSGRGITFDIKKLRVGRWGQLVCGTAPSNVKVDWSQYIDEDEENEMRSNPYGHDIFKMKGAMGKNWGSNMVQNIAARKQASKINTSAPEDDEDEITMA